jgi:hypothetical protein
MLDALVSNPAAAFAPGASAPKEAGLHSNPAEAGLHSPPEAGLHEDKVRA